MIAKFGVAAIPDQTLFDHKIEIYKIKSKVNLALLLTLKSFEFKKESLKSNTK